MQTKFTVIFVLLVVTMFMGQSSTQDAVTLPEPVLKSIFQGLIPDGNGLVSIDDDLPIKVLAGVQSYLPSLPGTDPIMLSAILTWADSDGDKKLSLDEFKNALSAIDIVAGDI